MAQEGGAPLAQAADDLDVVADLGRREGEHDASTFADAMAAECGLELTYGRHHEAKPRGVVGKFALRVEEVSAGDVRRLEAAATGDRDIRVIAPRWRRLQIGGAVKDPQIAPAQVACQCIGAYQGVRLA